MKNILKIIILLLVSIALISCSEKSNPKNTIENFYAAWFSGNMNNLKKYTTKQYQENIIKICKTLKKELPESKCLKELIKEMERIEVVEIKKTDINHAIGIIKYYYKDKVSTDEIFVEKINGIWLINGF